MKFNENIWISSFIIAVIVLTLTTQSNANEESDSSLDDYYGAALENLLQQNSQQNILTDKRSCIRRSGTCDHRPNDCCPKSVCRCNLWGTNCRCQRLGLFQKWGKR